MMESFNRKNDQTQRKSWKMVEIPFQSCYCWCRRRNSYNRVNRVLPLDPRQLHQELSLLLLHHLRYKLWNYFDLDAEIYASYEPACHILGAVIGHALLDQTPLPELTRPVTRNTSSWAAHYPTGQARTEA